MSMNLAEMIGKRLFLASTEHGENLDSFRDALPLVMEHLPQLQQALGAGLVTEYEVASAITDRFVVWLAMRSNRQFVGTPPSWNVVVSDVEAIVRSEHTGK